MEDQNRNPRSNRDRVPDEPALGGLDGRTTHALRSRAPRTLGISIWIENDAVSFAFRNFTHIIFDGNLQSLPWDYQFDDRQGRALAVDSRAIVEALRKVYAATNVVTELSGK